MYAIYVLCTHDYIVYVLYNKITLDTDTDTRWSQQNVCRITGHNSSVVHTIHTVASSMLQNLRPEWLLNDQGLCSQLSQIMRDGCTCPWLWCVVKGRKRTPSNVDGTKWNGRETASYPIGSMYAIYGNIYHQYTPNVSIYTIHGSYGYVFFLIILVRLWFPGQSSTRTYISAMAIWSRAPTNVHHFSQHPPVPRRYPNIFFLVMGVSENVL